MSEEWSQLLSELNKMSRGVEMAPSYLKHLMQMFVSDFDASVSERLDIKFWSKLKALMDEMSRASENDRLVDLNVQNLAIGFLTDLSLLVHCHYKMPNYGKDISQQLTWSPEVSVERKPVKSRRNCRIFMATILLRMGDLQRYKGNITRAREFYEQSCRINPADGAVWNQLGLLSAMSAQFLESSYFHTRALHASRAFSPASGNLSAIFKKFANKDLSKSMPNKDLYLACLAKIHFLLEIEDSDRCLKKIGELAATSKEMIVPLMSVYKHLEGGTDLEHRAIKYVKIVWETSYRSLLKTIEEKLHASDILTEKTATLLNLLVLLHSAPNFVRDSQDSETSRSVGSIEARLTHSSKHIESTDDTIKDLDGFAYFDCLQKIRYPLKKKQLVEILNKKTNTETEDEEEIDEENSSLDEEDEYDSLQRQISEERVQSPLSSDEETLQRGRRRGPNLTDSIDTDEDDF